MVMAPFDNVLEAVGNTPLIKLRRLTSANDAEVLVKYEGVNIGGSVKIRTALAMIEAAERDGLLRPDSVIAEPTSGNQGVSLALIAAVRGYKAVFAMPDSVSEERMKLIKHYGAEVILVPDKGNIGECIADCLKTVQRLAAENPKVFLPQQFENPANPEIHHQVTGREIIEQVPGPIHGFCSGIGTGGCLSGIGKLLRRTYPDALIWALEPANAAILSGGAIGTHLQMGIGDGLIPKNLDTTIYDAVEVISDDEAIQVAKDLARKEGLMCGVSSGTNVAGALRMAKQLGKGKIVVTLLPDTGERYFSTPLFDS
jgi:cysteine synthase A